MRTTANLNVVTNYIPGAKIIAVEEFYMPGAGMTSKMPDNGEFCFNNDLAIEDILYRLHKAGCTSVSLKLSVNGKTKYEDFPLKSFFA